MSVPKSKRSEPKCYAVINAKKVAEHTLNITANKNVFKCTSLDEKILQRLMEELIMPILKRNADFVSERKEATLMGQMDELKKSVEEQKELIKMLANKTGYTLNEIGETEAGSRAYEFVKDEAYTTSGTYLTPTEYKPGMTVVMYTNPDPFNGDGWYSFDGDVKVCIKTGTPKDFDDAEYFAYEI